MYLSGFGSGIGITTAVLTLPCYFQKYRGTATSSLVGGVSSSMFVQPIIVNFLLQYYSYRGSTFIFGGLMLHTVAAAALFHPVKWHSKYQIKSDDIKNKILFSDEKILSNNIKINNIEKNIEAKLLPSDKSNIKNLDSKKSKKRCISSFWKIVQSISHNVIEYIKILKHTRAIIIAFGYAFFMSGFVNFLVQVPFTLEVKGFPVDKCAWAVSISGITNTILRFTTSSLSDLPKFNRRFAYMTGAAVTGLSSFGRY